MRHNIRTRSQSYSVRCKFMKICLNWLIAESENRHARKSGHPCGATVKSRLSIEGKTSWRSDVEHTPNQRPGIPKRITGNNRSILLLILRTTQHALLRARKRSSVRVMYRTASPTVPGSLFLWTEQGIGGYNGYQGRE